MARRRRRDLRADSGPERLSILRAIRSGESFARFRTDERGERRHSPGHAAVQAVSRGENVVRAFLDAAAPGILAARIGRKIFPEIAGGDSVHVAARSDTVAAARRDSAP